MSLKGVTENPVEILVVEDNPGDVCLFLNEFRDIILPSNFHVLTNGVEALKFLNQVGKYADRPKPDLMVLDLDLPKVTGMEILREMSEDLNLNDIPVVIFSALKHEKEFLDNCKKIPNHIFIPKPYNLEDYQDVIKSVGEFWFSLKLK